MYWVDAQGLRRTPGAQCGAGAYKVFAFDGSTMWGVGSRGRFPHSSSHRLRRLAGTHFYLDDIAGRLEGEVPRATELLSQSRLFALISRLTSGGKRLTAEERASRDRLIADRIASLLASP